MQLSVWGTSPGRNDIFVTAFHASAGPHTLRSFSFQAWMNETHSYDAETFHPSMLHSVFVTLEGSQLRLSYPHANIPRWASFDESSHEAVFLRTRTYQLANCKVSTFVDRNILVSESCQGGGSWPLEECQRGKVTPHLNSHLSAPTMSSNTEVKDQRGYCWSDDVLNKHDPAAVPAVY